jgi:hypothetical protein
MVRMVATHIKEMRLRTRGRPSSRFLCLAVEVALGWVLWQEKVRLAFSSLFLYCTFTKCNKDNPWSGHVKTPGGNWRFELKC